MNALNKQIGGDHYKSGCQHTEFCTVNNITWNVAACVKYLTRHSRKNGAEDLDKAAHYLELHLELIKKYDLPDTGLQKLKIPVAVYANENHLPHNEWSILCTIVQNPFHVESLVHSHLEIIKLRDKTYNTMPTLTFMPSTRPDFEFQCNTRIDGVWYRAFFSSNDTRTVAYSGANFSGKSRHFTIDWETSTLLPH